MPPAVATRRLRIRWRGADAITGLLAVPVDAGPCGVLLAPGAGAGQRHPFLVSIRRGLAAGGVTTLSFDYPYMEAGRRRPDRHEVLVAAHHAAAERLAGYVEVVVLAGKSMGGRIGSHLAGDESWPAAGLVYYGYPLVPPGKAMLRPVDHLARIDAPQLFLSGTRDRLSPPSLLADVVAGLRGAELITIEDADHSFRVTKRSGIDPEEVMGTLVATTLDRVRVLGGS